ncbi:MAG: type 1 glutamine amidotransferase [Opitutaceae bacterium]|jgi:GMP synthase-like glutamine amidotransferase
MRIHWFQHVPFEGLGAIEGWLRDRGHTLTCTRFYAGETAPADVEGFDWLIIMGGPMNIYQYRDYPWLRAEKRVIREAVAANKRVLGVCLGAQLIADALGGKVYQNDECEIGWFSVTAVAEGAGSPFAFPAEAVVLHWHGDTFALPPGGVWLARSEACEHQAFAVGLRVLGLQFHLEMTADDATRIVKECGGELTHGHYVQTAAKIIELAPQQAAGAAVLLDRLLSRLEQG